MPTLESKGKTVSAEDQKTQQQEQLARTYGSLRAHLKQLEQENLNLARELDEKRRARAERLKQERKDGSRDRLKTLEQRLQKTDAVAQKQVRFLKKMRAFSRKNEEKLREIGVRLLKLEEVMNQGEVPVSAMKNELVSMLTELQEMRVRRESLLKSDD